MITFKGVVTKVFGTYPKRIILEAELSMYDGKKKKMTSNLTGDFFASVGDTLEGKASIEIQPGWGPRLKVTSVKISPFFETKEGIKRFLITDITGIGPKTAELLLNSMSAESLTELLDKRSSAITNVKGIGRKTAEMIWESWEARRSHLGAHVFLSKIGLKSSLRREKVIEKLGGKVETEITRNPYSLLDKTYGLSMPFAMVDSIAQGHFGIKPESDVRLQAGVSYSITREKDGNTYLDKEDLRDRMSLLLELYELESGLYNKALLDLSVKKEIVLEGNRVYSQRLYAAEKATARKLIELLQHCRLTLEPDEIETFIEIHEKRFGKKFNHDQKRALFTAGRRGVSIITGGPGTGKSFIIDILTKMFLFKDWKVTLCSPTGIVAQRMKSMTGHDAHTIHRTIGSVTKRNGRSFTAHKAGNELETDVIIVDELSMCDINLMSSLLAALKKGSKLVLIGDKDQLPSIGPGSVLRDMIRSTKIPVVTLIEIYRHGSGYIKENARKINNGNVDLLYGKPGEKADFYIDHNVSSKRVVSIIQRIMDTFSFSIDEIKVITPYKKDMVKINIRVLNEIIQRKFNPKRIETSTKFYDGTHKEFSNELSYNGCILRVGDPVIQLVNDYVNYIMNGDIGKVAAILSSDEDNPRLRVDFTNSSGDPRSVIYTGESLKLINLAYAMTVHKCQGSEFKAIIIILPEEPEAAGMMKRNLLYTAVTRAQKLCVLIGKKDIIEASIRDNSYTERNTSLDEKLEVAGGSTKGAHRR